MNLFHAQVWFSNVQLPTKVPPSLLSNNGTFPEPSLLPIVYLSMYAFPLSSQPKFATNIVIYVYFSFFSTTYAYWYPTKFASAVVAPRLIPNIRLSFQCLLSNKRLPNLLLSLFLVRNPKYWLSYQAPDPSLSPSLHLSMYVFLPSPRTKFATIIELLF